MLHADNAVHSWPGTFAHASKYSKKFHDAEYRERIRNARTAKTAAELGRSRKVALRPDWESIKDEVMRKAVREKFRVHAQLREMLLKTGSEAIVENAPGDYYWGCGRDGSGQNRLGSILEEVREELRAP